MPDPISWSHALPFLLLAATGGYLCGSIPFGLLLTRWAGLGDIRTIGSGNIGATNVLRTGNKGLAAATLLLDALKALVPVVVARQFGPDAMVVAGAFAFVGHLFPVWLRFKGGKGVACFFGIVFGIYWPVGLMAAGTWLLAAALFRFSSLAALLAAVLTPAYFWFGQRFQFAELAGFLAVLVILRHRENIGRLLAGTESKIGDKREQAQ